MTKRNTDLLSNNDMYEKYANVVEVVRNAKISIIHAGNTNMVQYHGLKDNKNILVFPEGTTRTNGIPKDFKHGIFQLAIEHNFNILPITIKYDKDIGTERSDPFNVSLIFNNNADVYIHDIIDSKTEEAYKNKDFLALKKKTFDIIFVDGRARLACAFMSTFLLKDTGKLFIHDFGTHTSHPYLPYRTYYDDVFLWFNYFSHVESMHCFNLITDEHKVNNNK